MKKIFTFLFVTLSTVMVSVSAFAQDAAANEYDAKAAAAWAAGIIMALASGLGTLGQSNAAASALEGIARNPQAADRIQTPMILALALMESLVIFGFVIAFILQGKI